MSNGQNEKCPICGEITSSYMGHYRKDGLCRDHAAQFKAGKIEQCERCGAWHKAGGACKCQSFKKPTYEKDASSELYCIICGNPSNGKHFCLDCWNTYKNRSVDIRITNCKETQILDAYGNKDIKCPDGRYVRSRAEALIISWLWEKRIRVIYEECIYYRDKETGETKELHPDFYLPDYDLYIEYNELSNKKYLRSKEYVMAIYKEKNKKVIIMTDEDLKDISRCLCPILNI